MCGGVGAFPHGSAGGTQLDGLLAGHCCRLPESLLDKLLLTGLYVLNIASSYLLMLAVMTFNVGYFCAVILGMGLGYFCLYEHLTPAMANRSDSCHVRLLD